MTPPASNDQQAPEDPASVLGKSPPQTVVSYTRTRAAEERLWERVYERLVATANWHISMQNWTYYPRPDPAEAVQEAIAWYVTQSGGGHYPQKDKERALEAKATISGWQESPATEEKLVEQVVRALQPLLWSVVRRPLGRKENQEGIAIINEHDQETFQFVNPNHLVKTIVDDKVVVSGDDEKEFCLSKLLPEEKKELFKNLESQCTAEQKLVLDAWRSGDLDDKIGAHSAVAAECGISPSKLSKTKTAIKHKGASVLAAFTAISHLTNLP